MVKQTFMTGNTLICGNTASDKTVLTKHLIDNELSVGRSVVVLVDVDHDLLGPSGYDGVDYSVINVDDCCESVDELINRESAIHDVVVIDGNILISDVSKLPKYEIGKSFVVVAQANVSSSGMLIDNMSNIFEYYKLDGESIDQAMLVSQDRKEGVLTVTSVYDRHSNSVGESVTFDLRELIGDEYA